MTDESTNISAKTRARALEPINKLGYMDGAADGQKASFQSSFDTAYEQGFKFGMEIAFNEAVARCRNESLMTNLQDTRQINCQTCIKGAGSQEDIVNLYNIQKEKNDEYLRNQKINTKPT